MRESVKIIVFSIDFVFIELIKRILDKIGVKCAIDVYRLFSEAKTITQKNDVDLIIIDDPIIGTSSYELISFLRLKQRVLSPIIYFGVSEYDGERKALLTGANYFFNKPFDPHEVDSVIQKIL